MMAANVASDSIPPPSVENVKKRRLEEEHQPKTPEFPFDITENGIHRLEKIKGRITKEIPLTTTTKKIENFAPFKAQLDLNLNTICSYHVATVSSMGKRTEMEDFFHVSEITTLMNEKIPLFAVMDGHAGEVTAKFIQKTLSQVVTTHFNLVDLSILNDEKMHDLFKQIADDLELLYEMHYPKDFSGSTLVYALVIKNVLWVVNTGDSRAVLNINGIGKQLSEDAKLNNPLFAKGVTKRHGTIIKNRLHGHLAVARAFGDLILRGKLTFQGEYLTGLTHRPKITKTLLTELPKGGKIDLILATDGIWDVIFSQESVDIVQGAKGVDEAAFNLGTQALKKHINDNLTAMIVNLYNPAYQYLEFN